PALPQLAASAVVAGLEHELVARLKLAESRAEVGVRPDLERDRLRRPGETEAEDQSERGGERARGPIYCHRHDDRIPCGAYERASHDGTGRLEGARLPQDAVLGGATRHPLSGLPLGGSDRARGGDRFPERRDARGGWSPVRRVPASVGRG